MKLTKEFLKDNNAYTELMVWFKKRFSCGEESEKVIAKLMLDGWFRQANWLLTRILDAKQNAEYAIYAAELALPIFERNRPGDDNAARMIKKIKKCLLNHSKKNQEEIRKANIFPSSATSLERIAWGVIETASNIMFVPSTDISYYAEGAAAYAGMAGGAAIENKIIKYGLSLIKEDKK